LVTARGRATAPLFNTKLKILDTKDTIMTELNVTEAKSLALVESFIDDIQNYVDVNIGEGTAMTAAAIYEGFKSDIGCNLNEEDFIKGFRAAVKADRITGIEGAKRAGYKRIGEALTKNAVDIDLENIEPYLDGIQAFVDKYIQGVTRMTASVIFEKFSKTTKFTLSEEEFVKSFRLAIREGKIQGLESAYKFGYKRASTEMVVTDDTTEEEKTGHDICEIVIDERRKLVVLDRLNWAFQVRRETGTWATEAYIPNIPSGMQCLARRLMDDELKGLSKFTLKDFMSRIIEAENHIIELITKIVPEKKAEREVKAA